MDDGREAKRARQACLNCRRKKTRCSGEKPVCACCARLKQPCTWNDGSTSPSSHANAPTSRVSSSAEANLAARVALLESRLSFFDADIPFDIFAPFTGASPSDREPPSIGNGNGNGTAQTDSANGIPSTGTPRNDFDSLPDDETLRSLVNVYFDYCHNQPYAHFHEAVFRQDFDDQVVPEYLLYAFAATACRFSDNEFYRDRQTEAIDAYARTSWSQISEQFFSHTDSLKIAMVQALGMLSTIDFAAGRTKLGWVKLALAVRFAQALRLNEEPDPQLPVHEQEERRRTFWSLYLLDVLMSVGPNRPPSFPDEDCTLSLPCHEDSFRDGLTDGVIPTLTTIIDHDNFSNLQNLDWFPWTILMASALGRLIRYSLKHALVGGHVLWDPRSKYYGVHKILLQFESHSPCTFGSTGSVLRQNLSLDGSLRQSRIGHLIFSQALFHVNHCLLNHPFILYRFFHTYTGPVPLSFAQEALQRCHNHATGLLNLLQEVASFGPLAHPSFYGYCGMAAGVISRLFEHHEDADTCKTSKGNSQAAQRLVEAKPVRWAHVGHMATLLRSFVPDDNIAKALVNPVNLSKKTSVPHGMFLWHLLDYAWLPRANSFGAPSSSLADLLPKIVQQPSDPAYNTNATTASTPGDPCHEQDAILPIYAHVLGGDMGAILSQAMGNNPLSRPDDLGEQPSIF
ncbi:hypothetical protein LTR99_009810 [Exophiala xenobiotica]|uniref:Zn(2)-C6 fungal-type domain-containing protein n=1 Tax=Vermiconidia calcicola TaxID=1690605 RepID=A0AAV9Q9M7_9PEZI|nr:hypothetical protein LTR99_009810 [Exophiala xenobiotica]KAK5536888.1 hypothetical protein LTR25_005563 [Vermiconidia calcicola]KAK5543033.1 hypothetical protein LTR23_005074 [Chaetothyriales sp. CCFEE 6169]